MHLGFLYTLSIILSLLTLIALSGLLLGMIKPSVVMFWGKREQRTRKRVFLYYGITILVCFIGTINTASYAPQEIIDSVEAQSQYKKDKAIEVAAKVESENKAKVEAKALEDKAKIVEELKRKEDEKKRQDEELKRKDDEKKRQDEEVKLKANEDEKRKVDETKTKIDTEATAVVEKETAELEYKVLEYDRKDNIVFVVTSPSHKAVRNATTKILNDKNLKVEKIGKDGAAVVISFYTDEKAARSAMKNDTTNAEEQYLEDHHYGSYSYSVNPHKYPPSIRIFKYVNHIQQVVEQIEP